MEVAIDTLQFVNRPKAKNGAGWIYALRSESLPGVLKVGHTAGRPERRLLQYNHLVGVINLQPFEIAWGVKVSNSARIEGLVHKALAISRLRDDREFFRVSLEHLWDVVEGIIRRPVPRGPWEPILTLAKQRLQRAVDRGRIPEFYDWLMENRDSLVSAKLPDIIAGFYEATRWRGRMVSEAYADMEWCRVRIECGIIAKSIFAWSKARNSPSAND